ncbi:hypothetical protein Tco_1486711 [Tanacetum coccineum]
MTSQFEAWNEEVLCKNVSLIDAGASAGFKPMTSQFKAWNEEVLCKNVSLIDAGARCFRIDHFDYGGPRSYEEKAFIQNGTTRSDRLDFRPMTSRFDSWNKEVLCKNVSLINAGPSVEENTILFMDAQDRMKKMPLFKWHNSVSQTWFQAPDQPIRSLERGSIVPKCLRTNHFVYGGPRSYEEKAFIQNGITRHKCLRIDHFDYGGPRSYEEKAFIQKGTTRSEKLDFRPMTSRFESWNEEVLCKNVSLFDAGPSVEENNILFMDAQDRMKKWHLFKMA